ncbi:glycosyltransferase family 2 protein [Dactylosporangium sp. CA-139114]|uniref:glycosyltransferase family 2 protein n=1 Tax=Dactylosporangium sp. CA-139114 TaxID=3239931 RepID=UPI003D983244
MSTTPSVSAVVLSRDRLGYTRRCLETLAATEGELEWIVVDNGSADGSGEYLRDWSERTGGTLIVNAADPGPARARNQAIAEATGEFLLFLDNDTVLDDPAWLSILLAELAARTDAVGASPLLLYPGPGELVQCAGGGTSAAAGSGCSAGAGRWPRSTPRRASRRGPPRRRCCCDAGPCSTPAVSTRRSIRWPCWRTSTFATGCAARAPRCCGSARPGCATSRARRFSTSATTCAAIGSATTG